MKKIIYLLLFIFCFSSIYAQQLIFPEKNRPLRYTFKQGDIVKIESKIAYIYNDSLYRLENASLMKYEEMNAKLKEMLGIKEKMDSIQKDILNGYKSIINIQNASYDSLKTASAKLELLVQNSVDNTKAALKYAKRIKYTSYLTSGVIGGIAGGLIDNKSSSFGLTGALLGVFGGAGINYFLQEYILGD